MVFWKVMGVNTGSLHCIMLTDSYRNIFCLRAQDKATNNIFCFKQKIQPMTVSKMKGSRQRSLCEWKRHWEDLEDMIKISFDSYKQQ